MRFLFWNTYNNININSIVQSMVNELGVDVLILAEYKADFRHLQFLLNKHDQEYQKAITDGCPRIHLWYRADSCVPSVQTDYYSIQIINDSFIVCCVHMPSDLYGDKSGERLEVCRYLMEDIKTVQKELCTDRVMIIGDLNEMPYGRGCLSANGLHGLPAFSINDRNTRKVNHREYIKYYNPMWNLLGDMNYPPGTFYYSGGGLYNPMWYMLDQIIISQAVIPIFDRDSLKIVTNFGNRKLYDSMKHPDRSISDHFPILCQVNDI